MDKVCSNDFQPSKTMKFQDLIVREYRYIRIESDLRLVCKLGPSGLVTFNTRNVCALAQMMPWSPPNDPVAISDVNIYDSQLVIVD